MQLETGQTGNNVSSTQGRPRLEISDKTGVALIRLGSAEERVVTLTFERLTALKEIFQILLSEKPRGLVITGSGADMFTAGADINSIANVNSADLGERLAREGQAVFDLLASIACTTVAAISGPCVGGGCEMVLACDYRIISDQKSSVIGLPEVKLGILPGFGGTQRLPRLIGLPNALDIILSGKTLRPKQALKNGLVDEVIAFHRLEERAQSLALTASKTKPSKLKFIDKILTFNRFGRDLVKRKALKTIQKETKGFYPAPSSALQATILGLEQGTQLGFKFEAKELGRLIVTPESKSLVRIFFLSEASKAIGKSAKKNVEQVHAVVIGAGIMGAGIAGVMAKSECQVILKDTSDEAVNRGLNQIKTNLGKLKYLSETERSFILNRIEVCSRDSASIGNANLAVEAIFEEMDVKKKVLGEISKLMPEDAIIATNTSSLSVSEIATAIDNPQRVVGMHFFNPVEKMPLLEIIRGSKTSDKTIAVIAALATKLGKFPIVVNDVPGFLVNRILSPYLNEAAFLFSEGFEINDIDQAALDFGMPMGPLRLLDEIGLDVAGHVADVMTKGYGERMKGPGLAKALSQMGRKGRKNSAGFYDFQEKAIVAHPGLHALLGVGSGAPKPGNKKLICDRLIMSLINEAVRCLDEGVAGAPGKEAIDQIDLGTVMGIGFPPFRGGLLYYANTLGLKHIASTLNNFEKEYGLRFKAADGILKRADRGLSLSDA